MAIAGDQKGMKHRLVIAFIMALLAMVAAAIKHELHL